MQKGSSFSDPRWRVLFLTGVAAFVVVLVLVTVASMSARVDPTPAQDVIRLETRINQLEQRLYTMEASIRNIEQQTRIANTTSRNGGVTANDLSQLIAQLQTLQVRVMEDE
jgi:cell division protein FtsL